MPVGGGDFQVIGDAIQLEAAQGRQEAARQGNGIQPIDGEVVSQQARFVGQEAEIETDIMPYQDGAIHKREKIGEDFGGFWRLIDHFLRDAGKLHDEGGQARAGIEQRLKRAEHLAPAQAHPGDLDDAVRAGAQARRLGVKHDKLDLVQGTVRAAPRRERPVRVL